VLRFPRTEYSIGAVGVVHRQRAKRIHNDGYFAPLGFHPLATRAIAIPTHPAHIRRALFVKQPTSRMTISKGGPGVKKGSNGRAQT
jgi:hypothetical protein